MPSVFSVEKVGRFFFFFFIKRSMIYNIEPLCLFIASVEIFESEFVQFNRYLGRSDFIILQVKLRESIANRL